MILSSGFYSVGTRRYTFLLRVYIDRMRDKSLFSQVMTKSEKAEKAEKAVTRNIYTFHSFVASYV